MKRRSRAFFALALIASSALALAAQAARSPRQQSPQLYQVSETTKGVSLAIGGASYGPYAGVFDMPSFSDDYRSWLLPARLPDGGLIAVFNGKEYPLDRKTQYLGEWVLSSDGRQFAGKIVLEGAEDEKRELLLCSRGSFGPFVSLELRKVGASWAAWARTESESEWSLILGDGTYGPYERIDDLAYDPFAKSVTALVSAGGETRVLASGIETGPWDKADLLRDAHGDLAALHLIGSEGHELFIEGKKFGPYDYAGGLWIAPDRKSFLLEARRQEQALLIRDGSETPVDWAEVYAFEDEALCLFAREGRIFVLGGLFEIGPFADARQRFFPRKDAWAVQVSARRGNAEISMIATPWGEFPGEGLRFDGAAFSWIRMDESGKAYLMRLPLQP